MKHPAFYDNIFISTKLLENVHITRVADFSKSSNLSITFED